MPPKQITSFHGTINHKKGYAIIDQLDPNIVRAWSPAKNNTQAFGIGDFGIVADRYFCRPQWQAPLVELSSV